MAEATHSYLDWQISTLMLAYDLHEPIPRHDTVRLTERQKKVEEEIHALAMATIPESYRTNPQAEFSPEVVMLLTNATLVRAARIAKIID